MSRRMRTSALAIAASIALTSAAGAASTVRTTHQAAAQVSEADAAPFLGDWTLSLQGPNGPGTFALSVKVDKGKVVGEIASDAMPLQAITDVQKSEKSLVLSFSFPYEGNPIPAVVTVTPGAEKVTAQIDFAGGAYTMTGTAAKKDQAK